MTISVPEAAHSLAIVTAKASVTDSSTLSISTTFALNSGQFTLAAGGVLQGGTVALNGGKFIAAGGTLSGDTFVGTLKLTTSAAQLNLVNGVSLFGTGSSGPAQIKLTGANSALGIVGPMTLDNATLRIGSAYGYASLKITDAAATGGAVTLGSALTISQTQTYARIGATYSTAGDALVNQGTIIAGLAGGRFNIYGTDSFVNRGTIGVLNADSLHIGNSFTNAGTVTVAGGTLTLDHLVSNTGTIAESSGAINLNGSLSTGSFGVVTRTGGSLNIGTTGTLNLGTSTFAVGTGAAVGQIGLLGTIIGGTIADGGSGLAFGGGTLSGVVYQGALDLSAAGSNVNVTNGITLEGSGGSGAGTVNLTGNNSYLVLHSPTTLNNATIDIGGIGSYAHLVVRDDTGTGAPTTLGPQLNIVQTGRFAAIGDIFRYRGDSLVNQGTITASVSAGAFTIYGSDSFFNQGTIVATGGDRIHITSNFNNSGTILVAGGTLVLDHLLSNTGTISESSGAVVLGGALTTALLESIVRTGGNITIGTSGVLTNTGGTISVGASTALGVVTVYGTIIGGTIVDAGGGLAIENALLSGVTYDGTIALSTAGASLRISNGITLAGAGGGGPGAISLTGYNSYLGLRGPNTFNNGVIDLGGTAGAATIELNNTSGVGGATTLGSSLTLVQTGSLAQIDVLQNFSADALINQGTIEATASGGSFNIFGAASFTNLGQIMIANGDTLGIATSAFTNAGQITVGNGDTLGISSGAFTNIGTIAISAGTVAITSLVQGSGVVDIGAGGLLELAAAGTLAGTLIGAGTLDLAGTAAVSLTSSASVSVSNVLDHVSLQTSAGVTLHNGAGAVWTIVGTAGAIQALGSGGTLGAGTFVNSGNFNTTGGAIDNVGVAFINYGNVYASSGTLNFLTALTNSGTLTIGSGATLTSAATIRGTGTIAIDNTGVLLLRHGSDVHQSVDFLGASGQLALAPSQLSFAGTISGFGSQDQIDLQNTVLTSESLIGGNRLVGQYNGATVAVIKFTGSYSLSNFAFNTDTHGGTLITHT